MDFTWQLTKRDGDIKKCPIVKLYPFILFSLRTESQFLLRQASGYLSVTTKSLQLMSLIIITIMVVVVWSYAKAHYTQTSDLKVCTYLGDI